MANLFTDNFTGSNGAAWNASNWTTSNVSSLNTAGSSATIQGNKGRLNAGTVTTYNGHMVIRYTGTNVANAEWIGKFTLTTAVDGALEVWLRADTANVDGKGYIAQFLLGTTNNVTLVRGNPAYTYTTIGTASQTITQNTEYGFRVYAVGTSIKVKVWPTSGSEPSPYNISVTDSGVTAAGYSYVHAKGGGSSGFIVDLDDVTLTDGTSNQFTYTGSCQPSGVFIRNQVNKNPFTGSVTTTGLWSYIKVVTRVFTASITSTGVLRKIGQKIFTGSSTAFGDEYKRVPKTLTGAVTGTGAFRKAFVRKFTGSITTVGTVVATFAGRVFGRPGIVKVTVEKAGEVRMRARRG